MDAYEVALQRLKADQRSYLQMERDSGIPWETLRDLKLGVCKNPRLSTIRKIVAHYSSRRRTS